jgi:hypothetical protein
MATFSSGTKLAARDRMIRLRATSKRPLAKARVTLQ